MTTLDATHAASAFLTLGVSGPNTVEQRLRSQPNAGSQSSGTGPSLLDSQLLPLRDSSKSALAAAVQERAQIDYDQPAESEQRAVGHYKAIATYAQRDQLQQMVGIDVYA